MKSKKILISVICFFAFVPIIAQSNHLSIFQKANKFTQIQLTDSVKINHIKDPLDQSFSIQIELETGRQLLYKLTEIDSIQLFAPNLPTLSFAFVEYPDAEQVWLKEDYVLSTLDVVGNGVVKDEKGMQLLIKGRGNTTFGMKKKPMRLKFNKMVSLCGLSNAKNYVLLSNYIDPSHTRNALALWLGKKLDMKYTNSFVPCNVFVNDKYVGLFLLTHKIGINKVSVDIDENEGILLECSSEYDELYKFKSIPYDLPVMVKSPDFDELFNNGESAVTPKLKLKQWEEDFNRSLMHVTQKDAEDYFDIDSYINYMLVYDILRNDELGHPRSCYIHKRKLSMNEKYYFGPIWDFDNSMNAYKINAEGDITQQTHLYLSNKRSFFKDFFKNQEICDKYHKRFMYFYDNIYPEMLEFIASYTQNISPSAQMDGYRWNQEQKIDNWASHLPSINHEYYCNSMVEWLKKRVEYLKDRCDKGTLCDSM